MRPGGGHGTCYFPYQLVQNTIFMTSLQYHCILGLAEIKTSHPRDKIISKKCRMRRKQKHCIRLKGWLVVGSSLFGLRLFGPCTVYNKLKTVVTTVCKQLEFRHNVNSKTFLLCVFFVVVESNTVNSPFCLQSVNLISKKGQLMCMTWDSVPSHLLQCIIKG